MLAKKKKRLRACKSKALRGRKRNRRERDGRQKKDKGWESNGKKERLNRKEQEMMDG